MMLSIAELIDDGSYTEITGCVLKAEGGLTRLGV
jgi:hypothetical protein